MKLILAILCTVSVALSPVFAGAPQQMLFATAPAGASPTPTPSGPTLVQDKAGAITGDTTLDVIFDAATTGGNSLFAVITHTVTGSVTSIATDGGFPSAMAPTGGGPSTNGVVTEIWYLHGASAAQTITVTLGSTDDFTVTIVEVTPLNNATEESYNSNTGTLNATVTTNSVTPSSAKNFVIAAGSWGLNDYSSGPTNGFTRGQHTGGGAVWQEVAYLGQSSATAQSTGWSLSAGINWASVIAVFGAP